MEKIVTLENISAGYAEEVILQHIDLTIKAQDFIGVIGPNGGGKTTLVKVILGLLKPMSGKLTLFDSKAEPGRRAMGYLPQVIKTDQKFPISVQDVVLSGLAERGKLFRRFTSKDRKQAVVLLDQMGIANLAKNNIGELSGGQMQRVFLCRAIIANPRLLILDEPSTYVDNKFEHDLYNILSDLNKQMAILMVSHDVGTITYYVKTIACVNRQLHYHASNIISQEQLASYNCPIQIIAHGDLPHTILQKHEH